MKAPAVHCLTFDLDAGDTRAILINSLSACVTLLEGQSAEQARFGEQEYSGRLAETADEARLLLIRVEQASA